MKRAKDDGCMCSPAELFEAWHAAALLLNPSVPAMLAVLSELLASVAVQARDTDHGRKLINEFRDLTLAKMLAQTPAAGAA